MVAYSFKAQFADPIVTLTKCQTVRADRKRHARPGEALQLFTGMRTKHCRKLITPDPICLDVRQISIRMTSQHFVIAGIEIDGIPLTDDEIAAFAIADGFGMQPSGRSPRHLMGLFWLHNHGSEDFDGVVIRWRPA